MFTTKGQIVEAQLTREVSAGTEVASNPVIAAEVIMVEMTRDLLTEAEVEEMEVAKNLILK